MSVLIQQNRSHSAQLLRRLVDLVPGEGALRIGDFAVAPRAGTPNMSVDVAPGSAVVPASVAARGRYVVVSDAVVNVPIAAAPGAGSSRADLIVARVADTQYGDASDALVIEALTGSPAAGTPADPVVPDGSIVLARVLVPAEAPAVTASDITDRRTFAGSVAWIGDGPLPSSAVPGQIVVRSDGSAVSRTESTWVPGVSAAQFAMMDTSFSGYAVPASMATVTGLTLPYPGGRPVSLHASCSGRHSGSGSVGLQVEVSWNGGVSWVSSGLRTNQQNRDDPNHPSTTSVDYRVTGTPTSGPRVRLRAQRFGGTSATISGGFGVTMQPAGV